MSDNIGDGSYENYLEHYGVKGMRWGKRQNNSDESTSAKPKKATKEEIINARTRQTARYEKVVGAEARYYTASTDRGRKLALANYKKLENELINNDDIAVARQRTKGEKLSRAAMLTIGTVTVAAILGQKK